MIVSKTGQISLTGFKFYSQPFQQFYSKITARLMLNMFDGYTMAKAKYKADGIIAIVACLIELKMLSFTSILPVH